MNLVIEHIYCYEKDKEVVQQWRSYLENKAYLIDLNELEEMFACTTSDSPTLLITREGSLTFAQIHVLSFVLKSFKDLQVLVLANFRHLAWCVEILKNERVAIEPLLHNKEEFLSQIKKYILHSPVHDRLSTFLDQLVKNCLNEKLSLEEAWHQVEKDILNKGTPVEKEYPNENPRKCA